MEKNILLLKMNLQSFYNSDTIIKIALIEK